MPDACGALEAHCLHLWLAMHVAGLPGSSHVASPPAPTSSCSAYQASVAQPPDRAASSRDESWLTSERTAELPDRPPCKHFPCASPYLPIKMCGTICASEQWLDAQCASDALAVLADVAGNAVDEMEVAGQLNVRAPAALLPALACMCWTEVS